MCLVESDEQKWNMQILQEEKKTLQLLTTFLTVSILVKQNACGYCAVFIHLLRLLCFAWPFIRMSMWFYQILTLFHPISSSHMLCQLQKRWINGAKTTKTTERKGLSMPLVPIKQYKCFRHNHGWWHLCCGFLKKSFFPVANATGKNYEYIFFRSAIVAFSFKRIKMGKKFEQVSGSSGR